MALGEKNNVKIDRMLPWKREYAFVDTEDHLADSLLIAREVPVRFRSKEYGSPDSSFVVVFCSFDAKYEEAFLKCMEDLERKIVMAGFEGYGDACEKVFGKALGDASGDFLR